ncbi:hypothetical protein [Phreatobacter aquaticus]|uniref:hypothetical protein n=1 Tax=Phreatobacter aquaticus TaxID=2570229 RepID=UPI00208F4EC9|nr:hypothetical protein [Phreatobacter aquaticus]
MSRLKTLAIAAVAASALTLAVTPKAEAAYFPWGAVVAGVVVGGAAVAIANSRSAHADPLPAYGSCYMVRRWVETPYGPAVRRIRVCD